MGPPLALHSNYGIHSTIRHKRGRDHETVHAGTYNEMTVGLGR